MMTPTVLAIDPATETGIADGIAGKIPALSVLRLRHDPDEDHDDLFRRAALWLWRRISVAAPDFLVIEAPVPPHRAKGFTTYNTSALALGLNGLYVGIARAAGVHVITAPIRTWRKGVLGRGDLPGEVAKRAMVKHCRLLGWDAPDHNAAEAAGIWLWACGQPAIVSRGA